MPLTGTRYGNGSKVGKGALAGVLVPVQELTPLELRGHKVAIGVDEGGNAFQILTEVYDATRWGKLGRERQPDATKLFYDLVVANLAQRGYFENNPHGAITEEERQNLPEVVNGRLLPDPASRAPVGEAIFIGEVVFQLPPSPDGKFDGRMTALVCPQLRLAVLQRITAFNAQWVARADAWIQTFVDQIASVVVNAVTFNLAGLLGNIEAIANVAAQFADAGKWDQLVGQAAAQSLGQVEAQGTDDPALALEGLRFTVRRLGQSPGDTPQGASPLAAQQTRKKVLLVAGVAGGALVLWALS